MLQPTQLSPIEMAEQRSIKTRDDVTLAYEVLGSGERTLLLANGLGGRLYSWEPLIDEFWREYRIITWDYRGLYESPCDTACRLSVRDHAEDALEILEAEGVRTATWIGWSMGVQVSLEAAAIAPQRIGGLVLMNGTYGHVFSSALQPVFRAPFLTRYMHELVEWLRRHPVWAERLAIVSKQGTTATVAAFWLFIGKRALGLRPMLKQYTSDIYQPGNFPNFLRLVQELDGHSAYHHLRRIRMPALVVSGRFDVLTPPYQSAEIARRLHAAEHLHVRGGSHFVLIERPEQVLPRIRRFLTEQVDWSVHSS